MVENITNSLRDDVLNRVRAQAPECVRAWFSGLECAGVRRGALVIRARNDAQRQYLDANCRASFTHAAQAATGRLLCVSFEAAEDLTIGATNNEHLGSGADLSDEFRLERFAVGAGNRFAHAAATAVAAQPGEVYNPLVICGEAGRGKTHLLQGLCHAAATRQPTSLVLFLPCKQFVRQVIEAAEGDSLQLLCAAFRKASIIALDDADFLAGRERSQEVFFHLLNDSLANGRQIVASLSRPPETVDGLAARLVSRLDSGLVATIEESCLDTRVAIVRQLADRACIDMPTEVLELIAQTVADGGHGLKHAVADVDRFCQDRGGIIDIALAELALRLTQPPASIASIISAVATRYSVAESELTSKKAKELLLPRQLCAYLALRLTGESLRAIAASGELGDAGKLELANRAIAERMGTDVGLNDIVAQLTEEIEEETHAAI